MNTAIGSAGEVFEACTGAVEPASGGEGVRHWQEALAASGREFSQTFPPEYVGRAARARAANAAANEARANEALLMAATMNGSMTGPDVHIHYHLDTTSRP